MQAPQRDCRIRAIRILRFDVVEDEPGIAGCGQRGHGEPMVDRSAGLRPVRWHSRRHDPHFVEGQRGPRGRRQREMTQVNRVEGAPEQADASWTRHSLGSG
jgi:hypothetical protein